MKKKSLIKFGISLLMMVLVLRYVDFPKLKSVLLGIPLHTVLAVVICYTLGQLISSFKWWLITRAGHIEVSYPNALKAYFIGMFVNCFGLGTIGGDVTRGLLVAPSGTPKSIALASVVADRAHGLAVLAFIGGISTVLVGSLTLDSTLVFSLSSLGLAVALGWFVGPALVLRIIPSTHRMHGKIKEMLEVFPRTPRTLITITVVSALFHLTQISLHKVMGYGLGLDIPWVYLLTIIPFINIIATLPISWNGLGVRENAYVFFLSPIVLSKEQAVAFGALWLLAVTVSSAVGGIVALFSKDLSSAQPAAV